MRVADIKLRRVW